MRHSPLLACLALAALLLPAAAGDTATGPCFEDWWRAEAAAIAREPASPRSYVRLARLARLAVTAADPGEVLAALDGIRRKAPPLLAAEIDRVLLEADLDRGDLAAAAVRRARLGTIDRWLLAGPRTVGAEAPTAPAPGTDPVAGGPWREVPADPLGNVPLHRLLTPAKDRAASLLAWIHADRRSRVALRLGADDSAEVRLDGELVLPATPDRDFAPDQEAVLLELSPGWHRLRIDTVQKDGPWVVAARLTGLDGSPPPRGVRAEIPGRVPPVAKQPRRRRSRSRGPAVLGDFPGSKGPRAPAVALAARALWLADHGLPSRGADEATAMARRAAEAAPDDPEVSWVRWSVEDDPSRGREALEHLLATHPGDPAALRTLARTYLAWGREEDAIAMAEQGVAACPGKDPFLAAWGALAADERGFPAGALATLRRLAETAPRQPVVLERIASLARRIGLPSLARDAYRRYLALRARDDDARGALLGLLERAADAEGALAVLEEARRIEPLDVTWTARTADLLLGLDRIEEARRLLTEGLARSPGNAELLRLAVEADLAAGDTGSAVARMRELVDRGLDTGHFAERIASLTGEEDSFGGAWAVSPGQAAAIERERRFDGDPEAVVVSHVAAWRLQESGLATRFHQVLIRIRHPEQAEWLRDYQVASWSPALRTVRLVEARLIRRDGSIVPAQRREAPLLPDPELRMWYDTRQLRALFPRFEEGDLLELRWRVSDRGPANPLGEGYFGDIVLLGRPVPVLSSVLVVDSPEGLPVHRDLLHLPAPPVEEDVDADPGRKVHVIRVGPLPAVRSAPLAPPAEERAPLAVLGTVDTWDHLGAIYARLLEDATHPDADIRAEVDRLLADHPSRREALRRIYEWVLENTRYVALELGIHAVKPYDVKAVFRRRHGDCKDKAALMVTMLRLAGIRAHVVLLRSRDRGAFPAKVPAFTAFDHAIVHVDEPDLWLDGTVLHYGLGELPSGDRGALALVVHDEPPGGTLVTTPEPRPEDAKIHWSEEITPERDGAAEIRMGLAARGEAAARERGYFRLAERPRAVLASRLRRRWPDATLLDARFGHLDLADPEVSWWALVRDERLGRREDDGTVSFPLALHVPRPEVAPPSPGRELPVRLPPPWHAVTEARWKLPPGVSPVDLPRPVRIESPWIDLVLDVRPARGRVTVVADVTFRGGEVGLEELPRLREVLRKVGQALDQRLVTRWLP